MREDGSSIPAHIAIVMDGNGRWAKARGRPRTIGHRAGARAVNRCIDWCVARGVGALTLFAFSSENWNRPAEEVGTLMQLFLRALDREVDDLGRRGIRLGFIGDREAFGADIRDRMARAESVTANGQAMRLTIAASYGENLSDTARNLLLGTIVVIGLYLTFRFIRPALFALLKKKATKGGRK